MASNVNCQWNTHFCSWPIMFPVHNKFAIGVFLDLQKAFDVISHEILIKKLYNLGIRDELLDWFKNYLSDRVQRVEVNGKLSSQKTINISVMQGSILGPLLFLCFINDLPDISDTLKLLLFADNTCALDSDKNLELLIVRINNELQKLLNWFTVNKISVNIGKCKYIIFHRNRTKIPNNISQIALNLNMIGQQKNNSLVVPLERIHNSNIIKITNILASYLMNT